ncbi:MAG: gustatory receptor family protein [Desulfobulbaceae bacterium]|nr:gustatory receptor family protein [Desulfobulbaceae bacterium]
MDDNEKNLKNEEDSQGQWQYIIGGLWRSPLGVFGVILTTVSITLMVVGLMLDVFGFIENTYANLFTYLVLPGGMFTGLAIIPLAAWLRRRQWHRFGISREHLHINLSDKRHRKGLIIFTVLTVVNLTVLSLIAYEGYHFTESPTFCGKVCHQVMAPEFAAYSRSAHSKVACVECHIGSGAEWFVRAKISGLRQVLAVFTDSYSRPIPSPVEHLRPSRDTCEQCHWPEKFHGKKVKNIKHYTNENQKKPSITNIALHIGGRNPETDVFEGIHWHVSKGVEIKYLAVDDKRTQIAKVHIKRADNSEDEFVKDSINVPAEKAEKWRVMDCTDCHSRPTHVYDMPEDVVDFGLSSKKINGAIPGIREDSFNVLTAEYASRDEAKKKIGPDLLNLQSKRNPKLSAADKKDIEKAGDYLVETYLNNVWPEMKVTWGTYQSHIGHRSLDFGNYKYADTTFGCFRCHDEEHSNKEGKTISQSCNQCHDEPA